MIMKHIKNTDASFILKIFAATAILVFVGFVRLSNAEETLCLNQATWSTEISPPLVLDLLHFFCSYTFLLLFLFVTKFNLHVAQSCAPIRWAFCQELVAWSIPLILGGRFWKKNSQSDVATTHFLLNMNLVQFFHNLISVRVLSPLTRFYSRFRKCL